MNVIMNMWRDDKNGVFTQWLELSYPTDKCFGLSPNTHKALGMIKMDQGDPATRLYDNKGKVKEIYRQQEDLKDDLLMADDPGAALLRNKINSDPIPLAEDSYLYTLGLKHYPYTGINRVLLVEGMYRTCKAAAWAQSVSTWVEFNGGFPVVGFYYNYAHALGDKKWPTGCTLYALTDKEVVYLKNEIWGHDVKKLEMKK